jgi:hypothetical protein
MHRSPHPQAFNLEQYKMKAQNKVVPLFDPANSIRIGNTVIHMDENGRYCLNDLHLASGGHEKDKPSQWLRANSAKRYVEFLTDLSANSHLALPIETIKGTANPGTFAVKELVYTYAAWVSIEFHHEVITIYDRVIMAERGQLEEARQKLEHSIPRHPNSISETIATRNTKIVKDAIQELIEVGFVINEPEAILKNHYRVTFQGAEAGFYDFQKSTVRVSEKAKELLLKLLRDKDINQTRWDDLNELANRMPH